MKGQLHDDNFEDFIRNKINSFDGEPSSDMWERIDGVIPPKPKPVYVKYIAHISIAASFLLVVTLWAVVSQFQTEKQKLTNELEQAERKIEDLKVQTETEDVADKAPLNNDIDKRQREKKNLTSINSEKLPTNQVTRKSNDAKRVVKKSNPSRSPSKSDSNISKTNKKPNIPIAKNNQQNKKSNIPAVKNNQQNKKANIPIAENNQENKKEINPSKKVNESRLPKQIVDVSGFLALEVKDIEPFLIPKVVYEDRLVPPLPSPLTTKKRVPKNQIKTSVSLNAQRLLVAKNNYKPAPPPQGGQTRPHPHPQKDDFRLSKGYNVGASLNVELGKHWSVSIGANYQKETVRLRLHSRLDYNPNTETSFDDEFFINNQSYPSECAFGDLGVNVDLFRNKNSPPLPGMQPLELKLLGLHTKKTINIPVSVQYERFFGEKFSVGLRGGVAVQFLNSNEFNPMSVETSDENIVADGVRLTEAPKLSQKLSFDALSGVSFNYKISDKIKLSVIPTAITSINEKHRSQRGSSKSTLFGIQGAITYAF